MKKSNCLGLTRVELVALIIILEIILVIAIPSVSKITERFRKSSMESESKIVLNALRVRMIQDHEFDPTKVNESNIKRILGLEADNYKNLDITIRNDVLYISVVGKGNWHGLFACGTYFKINVSTNTCDLTY